MDMAIFKPKRGTWKKSSRHSPQREPIILTPSLLNSILQNHGNKCLLSKALCLWYIVKAVLATISNTNHV